MSKKSDKSRKVSEVKKQKQAIRDRIQKQIKASKDAANQIKKNRSEMRKLDKQNSSLRNEVLKGKYLNKFVIVNHVDADGSICYYCNNLGRRDQLLTEGDDNPDLDDLNNDGGRYGQIFTTSQVSTFINECLSKLSEMGYTKPMLYFMKRRLYGSVIPASYAINHTKEYRDF